MSTYNSGQPLISNHPEILHGYITRLLPGTTNPDYQAKALINKVTNNLGADQVLLTTVRHDKLQKCISAIYTTAVKNALDAAEEVAQQELATFGNGNFINLNTNCARPEVLGKLVRYMAATQWDSISTSWIGSPVTETAALPDNIVVCIGPKFLGIPIPLLQYAQRGAGTNANVAALHLINMENSNHNSACDAFGLWMERGYNPVNTSGGGVTTARNHHL